MFDNNSNAIAQALVKFYEHERMILDSVKWAYEKMRVNSETGEKIYKQYTDAVEYLNRLYLLCIKYTMKSNEEAVRNFINKTIEFSAKRKAVLRELIEFLKNEYVKYVSIKLIEN